MDLIKKLRELNFNLVYLDKCGSTNVFANVLIKNNLIEDFTIVIAEHQTQGKGQANMDWQSEDGKNLTFSIVIKPHFLVAENLFYLSIIASLSVQDSLAYFGIKDLKIKWPNDIYVMNKKICGILVESHIQDKNVNSSIIGIGLNVNQKLFLSEKAISASLVLNKEIYKDDLLIEILKKFSDNYSLLVNGDYHLLHELYMKNLYRYNELHTFKNSNEVFQATISGITRDGHLLVRLLDGSMLEYSSKAIEFIS